MFEIKLYFSYEFNDNLIDIIDYLNDLFNAFTYYKIKGYYEGKCEESVIVELITDNSFKTKAKIELIIDFIKFVGNQESVLYTIKDLKECELR